LPWFGYYGYSTGWRSETGRYANRKLLSSSGSCENKSLREKYWWKFLDEGVEMGKKIEAILKDRARKQV
jgi:hypothetical protein